MRKLEYAYINYEGKKLKYKILNIGFCYRNKRTIDANISSMFMPERIVSCDNFMDIHEIQNHYMSSAIIFKMEKKCKLFPQFGDFAFKPTNY